MFSGSIRHAKTKVRKALDRSINMIDKNREERSRIRAKYDKIVDTLESTETEDSGDEGDGDDESGYSGYSGHSVNETNEGNESKGRREGIGEEMKEGRKGTNEINEFNDNERDEISDENNESDDETNESNGLIDTHISDLSTTPINDFEILSYDPPKPLKIDQNKLNLLKALDDQLTQIPLTPVPSTMSLESSLTIPPRKSSRSQRIELSRPEPTTEISETLIATEKEKHQVRKRLMAIARSSKGRGGHAIKRTKDFRSKIYKSLIKTFEIGDIILKERVLILVKEAISAKSFETFSENEPCDTRVVERWREYTLVTRKTSQSSMVLQFFKVSDERETNTDKASPAYERKLDSEVKVNLYSSMDKSISISYPHKNWSTINIVKFHTQKKSIKWLYFLKQVIGANLNPDFKISIPDIGLSITLYPPYDIILASMKQPTQVEVQTQSKGYKVKHSPLIQYLIDTIMAQLSETSEQNISNWVQKTDRPWFCFRHYDHLQWIEDDSELLFTQMQIPQTMFTLELRNIEAGKRHIGDIHEPIPIEGFLSRLTTASGNETSGLRPFYKVSYFNSTDNLLFFSKYYRCLPPKITNTKSSNLFEHCSYEIDENSHVTWFETDEFMDKDHLCSEEFQRRGLLITKSDSVIDLTLVDTIKPVPVQEIKLPQKVLLGVLWYGDSTVIEDLEIIDSVFEITTINSGRIRLQAPNKEVRNEWIQRLSDISDYWKLKRKNQIHKAALTREKNIKALNIDEYTDSNISQETGLLLGNSFADTQINSIDSISMTNHISMNGYLYQKYKKHSNFSQYYAVLSSGCLILYSLYKRSKVTGEWKTVPYFQHYLTIPLTECYVYSGFQTSLDLVQWNNDIDHSSPGNQSLPRIYVDGWKSQEEEPMRCFTVWFGRKRSIAKRHVNEPKNPGIVKMIGKLGLTGQSIVFMARSRQEREMWVSRIYTEIDRFTSLYNLDE